MSKRCASSSVPAPGVPRRRSRSQISGYADGRAGRSSDARAIITELTNRSVREYVSPYALALVHAGLGENDRAMEWLGRAYDERSPRLVFLNVEPMLDGLRTDPRFTLLVQRVGLPTKAGR